MGDRTRDAVDISFKPFAGAKKGERQSVNEIGRFLREDKRWALTFERAELQTPTPLRDTTDAAGVTSAGYLTTMVNSLRSSTLQADVLSTDVLDLGQLRVGLITASIKLQNDTALLQQAVVEVSPKVYYALAMTSPAPAKDLEQDPGVQEAVTTFKAVVDSIEKVDLSKIRDDQVERLFRTRALFVEWNRQKLLGVLKPEQMLRFRKGGKDVGYSYVVEQPADTLPRDGEMEKAAAVEKDKISGFRVGTRSRNVDDNGKSVDLESWMYVSFDRRNEIWSNVTVVRDPKAEREADKEVWFSEVGASDMHKERVFDKNLTPKDFKEADKQGQLPFDVVDKYRLVVRTESKNSVADPLKRDLPPYYMPQAFVWTLPRLLPLDRPTGYMFYNYQSAARQVMLRYVDVGLEGEVTLGGKRQRAVPVIERIGFEGQPTTHFYTPKGEYLGTLIAETGVEILPTDRATLEGIWKDSNLNAPAAVRDKSLQAK